MRRLPPQVGPVAGIEAGTEAGTEDGAGVGTEAESAYNCMSCCRRRCQFWYFVLLIDIYGNGCSSKVEQPSERFTCNIWGQGHLIKLATLMSTTNVVHPKYWESVYECVCV